MKILLVFRIQADTFDFQSKVIFGGIEKFAKQIYDLFPGQVEICQITKSDRKNRNSVRKIKNAIAQHSPDLAIINDPSGTFFKPFIELGVPLISIIHEPLVRDIRFLNLGPRLNEFMDQGVHVYFVSEVQHEFHSKMSKRINDVDIHTPTGYIHSSYISNDFVVSKEHDYDVGTIGRMDPMKNPFFIHNKAKGTGMKSLVISGKVKASDFKPGHPIEGYQNKNLDWKEPQTTMLGLPHNEVLMNMSKCKTFVSTCADESWGITSLEALGAGIPIMLVINEKSGSNHASEIIPAAPGHYMKISRKISNDDFKDVAMKLGNIIYDQRVEIAEMTKEKHSEEKYRQTWQNMLDYRISDKSMPKPASLEDFFCEEV